MLQIAQGLHYLHSMNVVHCDLSGNKTLISDDYCAVLSDFGLATTIWDGDLDTTAGTLYQSITALCPSGSCSSHIRSFVVFIQTLDCSWVPRLSAPVLVVRVFYSYMTSSLHKNSYVVNWQFQLWDRVSMSYPSPLPDTLNALFLVMALDILYTYNIT
ncbi:hypothetical protein B0H13DRAFT_1591532 [Mycena leptocephala]|nr:hypothetical protein B0H13DRAFT_1591532 [Mycena leptocephala]